MRVELQQRASKAELRPSRWWYLADGLIFGCWVAIVSIIEHRHEPWADESQAWLLARDLDLKTLWFSELRYEGTPGLWHTILWITQHWFHAPYSALSVIGVVCAATGVAFILWKGPFPRPLRYLLVFSYFIIYQFAVVARSYNLLPLFLFMAAYFYNDRTRPVRMAAALLLLSSVAVHGMFLALALGICYLIELSEDWQGLSAKVRRNYFACSVALAVWCSFLFFILKPTPDVAEFASGVKGTQPPPSAKLEWVMQYAFFDLLPLSIAFLILAGGWCYYKRKLLPFVLTVGGMIFLFVAVHGRPHHQGIVFLAAVASLGIAWRNETHVSVHFKADRLLQYGMTGLLALLFCVNIWDAKVSMENDYFYPYSGSLDATRYLRSVGAENTRIFGYTYGMSAVQAYFDHNILANIPTTYFHEGLPLQGAHLDVSELRMAMPDYVVIYSNDDKGVFPLAESYLPPVGYHLVHKSYGSEFYKSTWFDDDSYLIYKRNY